MQHHLLIMRPMMQCGMNGKVAKERDAARKNMLDAAFSCEMKKMADRGKSFEK